MPFLKIKRPTKPKVEIDYTDTTENITMPTEWTNMPLTFDENGSEITVSFTITNLATDRNIDTTITDTTVANGFTVTRDCDGETISETDNRIITDSATYTFKLNVSSKNSPASGTFGINVHLGNTTEEPQEGYTVTVNCVYGKTDSVTTGGLNIIINDYDGSSGEGLPEGNTTFYNVERVIFCSQVSSFTRALVGASFTATVTSSDGSINDSMHFVNNSSGIDEYLGWYEITQNTTFNIVVEYDV